MMINGETELKKLDSMIDRIQSIYPAELLNKSVAGILIVSDLVVNYVTMYRTYPNEKTIDFLIQTTEDSLQDTMYEFALKKVESIIQDIEGVD